MNNTCASFVIMVSNPVASLAKFFFALSPKRNFIKGYST